MVREHQQSSCGILPSFFVKRVQLLHRQGEGAKIFGICIHSSQVC